MVNKNSNNLSEIQAQWVTVRSKIRQKIGAAQFASWIKLLTLVGYDDQKVTLSVPSNFIRTRIIEQYLDIIKSYWLVQILKVNDIEIASMDDKSIFGEILYQLKFSEAIKCMCEFCLSRSVLIKPAISSSADNRLSIEAPLLLIYIL